MRVEQDGPLVVIHMNGWKLRLQAIEGTDAEWLDLNLMDDRMSPMKVQPQAGNVIRVRPDDRF